MRLSKRTALAFQITILLIHQLSPLLVADQQSFFVHK